MNCIGNSRPSSKEFTEYLEWFLLENPGLQCATGGHAAFNASVTLAPDGKTVLGKVMAFGRSRVSPVHSYIVRSVVP